MQRSSLFGHTLILPNRTLSSWIPAHENKIGAHANAGADPHRPQGCAIPRNLRRAPFQLSYQLEVPEDGVEHDKHAYVVGEPLNIVCATFGMLRIGTAKA